MTCFHQMCFLHVYIDEELKLQIKAALYDSCRIPCEFVYFNVWQVLWIFIINIWKSTKHSHKNSSVCAPCVDMWTPWVQKAVHSFELNEEDIIREKSASFLLVCYFPLWSSLKTIQLMVSTTCVNTASSQVFQYFFGEFSIFMHMVLLHEFPAYVKHYPFPDVLSAIAFTSLHFPLPAVPPQAPQEMRQKLTAQFGNQMTPKETYSAVGRKERPTLTPVLAQGRH